VLRRVSPTSGEDKTSISEDVMIELLPLCFSLLGAAPPASAAVPAAAARTAVVVTLEGRELPAPEAMQGWFIAGGEPRRVLAVEKGPAEVMVVRDPAAQQYLDLLAGGFLDREIVNAKGYKPKPLDALADKHWDPQILKLDEEAFIEVGMTFCSPRLVLESELRVARARLRHACNLGEGARVRFISPMAAPVSRITGQMNIFLQSPTLPAGKRGFLTWVDQVPQLDFNLRVSDAVWLAAHELQATDRRRAVVTWIDGRSKDQSLHPATSLPGVLERLQVPNFVWSFGPGPLFDAWGGNLVVDHYGDLDVPAALARFETACGELKAALGAQRVVWIDGEHAAWQIRLGPEASGVRLAGSRPAPPADAGREVASGSSEARP
jgi:hypothetical protein